MSKKNFLQSKYRGVLKDFLEKRFSLEELKSLAFEIGITYDSIPHDTVPTFVRELILLCERTGLLISLIEAVLKHRNDEKIAELLPKIITPEEDENWKNNLKVYLRKMHERYNKLILLGSSDPAPLEGVFTDVYLLDKVSAERRSSFLDVGKEMELLEHNAERENAVAFVCNPKVKHVMILGKPGAGKTTFLKHLVMQATDGRIDKVPIFVILKQWSDKESGLSITGLLSFMAEQFDICGFSDAEPFIEYILQEGQALVLLDGLDEINQRDENGKELRNKAIKTIEDFAVKFDQSKCVMTCRVAANEYRFLDFKYAEVADFIPEQVNAFVDKWFRNDLKLRDLFKSELNKSVNRGLRDLTTSPMLLSLVCLAYEETREFPPGRRVEIYKQAVDALMRKWDISRGIKRDAPYKGMTLGQKENLIAEVAAKTFEKGDYFLRKQFLAEKVQEYLGKIFALPPDRGDGEVVMKQVEAQNSIWVERAHDIYSFSHLSLQEYLTADYIKNSGSSRVLKTLLSSEHIVDNRWREVILNIAGMLSYPEEFFEFYSQTLQKMMAQSLSLHDFFDWAKCKSASNSHGLKPEIASIVIGELISDSYALTVPRARDLALARALNFPQDLPSVHDLDLVGAFDPASDLVPTFAIVRDLIHATIRARDFAIALVTTPIRDLDLYASIVANVCATIAYMPMKDESVKQLERTWQKTMEFAQQTGKDNLAKAMNQMCIPNADASKQEWLAFAAQTRALINQHLDVGYKWNFSEEDYKTLGNIFSAAKLMLECLEVATVSPEVRQRVRDNILTIDE